MGSAVIHTSQWRASSKPVDMILTPVSIIISGASQVTKANNSVPELEKQMLHV